MSLLHRCMSLLNSSDSRFVRLEPLLDLALLFLLRLLHRALIEIEQGANHGLLYQQLHGRWHFPRFLVRSFHLLNLLTFVLDDLLLGLCHILLHVPGCLFLAHCLFHLLPFFPCR